MENIQDVANGYVVYRSTSKSGKKKAIKTITSGNTVSYKNVKLSSGKTYYYWIKTKVYGTFSSVQNTRVK